MNKLTQAQKETIYTYGCSLGIDSDTMQLIASQMQYHNGFGCHFDSKNAQDFILGAITWQESPQGHAFWRNIYEAYENIEPQEEVPLTQADIQSLLHIVRDSLNDVTYNKQHSSAVAGEYWAKSDKENPDTSVDFHCFSVHNKYTKEMKAKEKKLVHLIKRLKAMR